MKKDELVEKITYMVVQNGKKERKKGQKKEKERKNIRK